MGARYLASILFCCVMESNAVFLCNMVSMVAVYVIEMTTFVRLN